MPTVRKNVAILLMKYKVKNIIIIKSTNKIQSTDITLLEKNFKENKNIDIKIQQDLPFLGFDSTRTLHRSLVNLTQYKQENN